MLMLIAGSRSTVDRLSRDAMRGASSREFHSLSACEYAQFRELSGRYIVLCGSRQVNGCAFIDTCIGLVRVVGSEEELRRQKKERERREEPALHSHTCVSASRSLSPPDLPCGRCNVCYHSCKLASGMRNCTFESIDLPAALATLGCDSRPSQ